MGPRLRRSARSTGHARVAASSGWHRWLKITAIGTSFWMAAWGAASTVDTAVSAASTVAPPATTPNQAAMATAFASYEGIPLSDVGALRSGSLHTAYDTATQTYWGTASFLPSSQAGAAVAVRFQDGGGIGIFQSSNGSTWTMTGVGGEPFPCAGQVPVAVEAAWGLTNSPYCATGSTAPTLVPSANQSTTIQQAPLSPIANIAASQVGLGDTPASTNWSLDCDPYTRLVAVGASTAGCGVDPHFNVLDENEFWCADFAKWVWAAAGVKVDLGALNPGANSFYTWGREVGATLIPDGNNPAVGDAVVFYPPGELTASGIGYADHVAIVVGVNPNGTVNLVNGDFGGATNISVQLYNDVSIASWASYIWNPGEQWVYVSPGGAGSGIPSGSPAALANSPSLMNVFFRNSAGVIRNDYWTPTAGWRVQSLPGAGASGDPAALANSTAWMNVFYTTTGGRVQNDYWNPTAGWLSQTLPGGGAVGDVAVIANSPSLMNVFYTTTSGQIDSDFWTPTLGWVNEALPGGGAASAPTAVANSGSWMNVWYTATNGQIVNDYWTPSTGWVSQHLPSGFATGAPTAVANSPTWMNVWYTTLNGSIYDDYWTVSGGWISGPLPGGGATGTPSGVVNSPSWMNVWYLTNDGRIYDDYWTVSGGWISGPLPGGGATGTPTGLVNSLSWMNVFYVTANGGVDSDYWTQSGGWFDQALPN
jgi:CHAP domain